MFQFNSIEDEVTCLKLLRNPDHRKNFVVDACTVCRKNLKLMQVGADMCVFLIHYIVAHHHMVGKNRSPSVLDSTSDFLAGGSIIMFAKFAPLPPASIALLIL